MVIEIVEPALKCAEDENIFFSRLAEVRGCQKVVGSGLKVYLTIAAQMEEDASQGEKIIEEVQQICDIWNARFKIV